MAKPVLLQDDFSGGMKPDIPVGKLPKNAVVNLVDFIPSYEGSISIRGNRNRTAALGNTYAAAVAFAPFSAGGQLVGITDTGAVKQVPHATAAAVTARGTAQVPLQPPVFYRNVLYIPSSNGTATVKSYGGSSDAVAASGSPPAGMFATVYKDHLVLGRDATNSQRVWFSNGGDAGSWDTAADGQWLDCSFPLTGIAALRNMILVFSEQGTERIRGDIIPGVAGSDMVREPLFAASTADPGSVVVADDICIFANSNGVYMTDGITLADLTEQGGVSQYWRKKNLNYASNSVYAAGYHKGKYIIALSNAGSFVTCMVCDVKTRTWWEWTDVNASMFASVPSGYAGSSAGLLFMAERGASYLADAANLFYGRAESGNFLFGYTGLSEYVSVLPTPRVRTGFFGNTPGLKRIKNVFVNYTASGSQSTPASVYVNVDSGLSSSLSTSLGTLTSAGGSGPFDFRQQYAVNKRAYGVGLDVKWTTAAANNTASFRINSLEADMRELEGSR
jgi:hypothetical protein